MRARELAESFPTVSVADDVLTAARLMCTQHAPGLIVCGRDDRPYAVLSGSQVLNFVLPDYVLDQPGLARALDEQAADEFRESVAGHSVADILPEPAEARQLPTVAADATPVEVAAVMARLHSSLVAVVDDHGRVLGAVTVDRLLTELLPT